LSKSPYLHKTLDNGVRVVAEKFDTVQSVSIGFFFKTGVIYEPEDMLGVSHFIEHMMFKGTSSRSARKIAREFDRIGGYLNAFTAKDYCCFYARVVKDHIEVAIDVLSDMLTDSQFVADEFERERRVILEEIKMYEDSPDEIIHELLGQNLWQNSRLGNPILGTAHTVSSLQKDAVVELFKNQYLTGNLCVCVAGNFEWGALTKLLETKLASMKQGCLESKEGVPDANYGFSVYQKDIEQVHLSLGTTGIPFSNRKRYALTLLNIVFGGGMSSRLFQEIREKRGMAYTVYSYHTSFRNTGLFGIYAGTSMEHLTAVLDLFYHELNKVAAEGITETELDETREQLKGNLLIALESTTNRMNRLSTGFLYDVEPLSPQNTIKPYLEVELSDIRAIAAEILKEEFMAITMIAPEFSAADALLNSSFSSRPLKKERLSKNNSKG
jgi:predicted Zn-dependent peptidase